MQPRAAALLWDLHTAAKRIQEFVARRTWEEYAEDVCSVPLSSGSSRLPVRL